jgi:membrane protein YdbS with pleckstrin-like domain
MMDASVTPSLPLEPANRLDRRALTVWRIGNLIGAVVFTVIIVVAAVIVIRLTDGVADWLVSAIAVALIGVTAALAWSQPQIDWRHWRYEIRDDEIDIKHGWLTATRTLVPISRVQHIDTQRNPIERRYKAATLVIHTAAGTVSIPALPDDLATAIGTRITALANIHDDL